MGSWCINIQGVYKYLIGYIWIIYPSSGFWLLYLCVCSRKRLPQNGLTHPNIVRVYDYVEDQELRAVSHSAFVGDMAGDLMQRPGR